VGALLEGAGRLLDGSALEAVRKGLIAQGLDVASPAQCQSDLETWQRSWPDLLLPAQQGASERRRLCVGLTLWAATLPDASAGGFGDPELVDEDAVAARRAALEESHADVAMDEDEMPPPEPDEFCPPLNAVKVVACLGAEVVSKAAEEAGGALPAGEDFAAALEQFRKALEAVAPTYVEAEVKAAAADSENGAEGARSNGPTPSITTVTEDAAVEVVSLLDEQRRGCIYCALYIDAEAAFDAATEAYTFAEGGTARTSEELLEYYLELCKGEPLLRALIAPFSPRDPNRVASLRELLARLPPQVVVIEADRAAEGVDEVDCFGEAADRGCGVGYLHDVRLQALGLASQYGRCNWLFAQTHGVYDFGASPEYAPAMASYLDVALALPESGRRFLLPKTGSVEELTGLLSPVDGYLRWLFLSAYGQSHSKDKSKNLTLAQFKEGLRKLDYEGDDAQIEAVFSFLDFTNNGSISEKELGVLEYVNGPASLQDLDDLRIWLCEWQTQKKRRHAKSGAAAALEDESVSPFSELYARMDRNGSGMVSFGEFKKALKKVKYPGTAGNDGRLHELFMCLDTKHDGTISKQEFYRLNILSAKYQLQRVGFVRDFLRERFGSSKASFKALDEDRSGSLSAEEWMKKMGNQHGYSATEDMKACFHFIDKDGSMVLTSKEFDFLGNFNENLFFQDVRALRKHLGEKFGSIEAAYDAFEQRRGPNTSAPEGGSGSHRGGKGIEPKDFLTACRLAGFKATHDPRLLFNFLDASHTGRLQRSEFYLLEKLDAIEELEQSSEIMHEAIASLKAFALKDAPSKPGCGEEHWITLHQELRAVTHDDF